MNKIEYYYYFGVLEENVGYDKNQKVTLDEIKKCIMLEELDKYSKVEFNPTNLSQPDMIALINDEVNFGVLKTGEKGSGYKITFKSLEYALSYMLASLRLKKKEFLENIKDQKKML